MASDAEALRQRRRAKVLAGGTDRLAMLQGAKTAAVDTQLPEALLDGHDRQPDSLAATAPAATLPAEPVAGAPAEPATPAVLLPNEKLQQLPEEERQRLLDQAAQLRQAVQHMKEAEASQATRAAAVAAAAATAAPVPGAAASAGPLSLLLAWNPLAGWSLAWPRPPANHVVIVLTVTVAALAASLYDQPVGFFFFEDVTVERQGR